MSSRVEIILENTPFPGAGQEIGGHKVIESMVDVEGKNWAVYIKGKLSQSQVKTALTGLTTTHFALPVQDEFSLVSFKPKGMTHARTNPPGDVTVVRGHMYYARPNPISKTDFHEEMDEMLIDNPEKHFTKYTVKNTDALHERLWKGVSYAGESYGWKKGDELWHRRASFIMPKIKINKALKGATMFYHTHPSKDEPSLTSADDIQFYLDLHFAWGIKSFYTVMKHKLDHFTITSKKGGEEKYLRMSEDAFIDTVDGMIGKGEEVAKKEVGEDRPEVEFQNRITKEMVDLFNKKFKSIAKISFRPKAKNTASKLARKPATNPLTALVNPAPNPPIKVKDQYVAKALEELKGLDYAHEHYGADEYGHTMYVYWWLKHHLAPTDKQPKGRLFKLNEYGLDSDTRKKLRSYLSQPIIGNYNYMDAVYLLALYHDIAKLREKGVKEPGWEIGAEMFRNEIGPELNLPSKLTEDLAFLFDTDLGRKGIADEDFLTQSGDYYGASKLVQMADMITHHPTMYTKKGGQAYKQEAMVSMINQLRVFLDHHYVIQNPPPQVNTLQWVSDYGIEDIAYEAAEELLGEFHQSVIPDNDGKTKQPNDKSSGGHIYYMRFNNSVLPGLSRTYSANLALSSSKLTIFVASPTPDDLGKKVANDIYQLVGSKLQESYLEIELEVPAPEVQVNPRHAGKIQIISISGPSGGGKSTVLHYLSKHIPNSSTPPTYTTRPKRRSDGPDRKFVSKTQFKSMLKSGEFVEHTVSANGHYYGRRFKDFLGNVAIIEVSLAGKKDYEKRFANMFTVYLDPDPSVTEEQRAKDIFKRGGLTKEEAKRRAKSATELVEKSKKMQFDLRVTMLKGKYNDGAKKILSEVPLVNARHTLDVGISQEEQEAANRAREERRAEAAAEAAELAEQFPQDDMDVGITREEQEENDRLLAEDKERIRREEEEAEEERRRYEESLVQNSLTIVTEEEEQKQKEEEERERAYRDMHDDAPWANPKKDLFDWFEDWAKLINMKNKELKTFLDSDWGKVAGLSPQEAKKLGINSGRTSGRRILKMREKLGLGGPKDYIKGPRHLEDMYAKAIDKWTGPATKKGTDWYWCTRQVRFNKRFMGDNFGERKGPLVKKQKTQNQPSRRLLSLWVWGHDPWRYARKNGINRMPKCPDVPWVGRTEKIKYGKIEVIPGPRKNPPTMISAPDYEKWGKRYDNITTASVDELADMANKKLEELKVDHGMNIFTPEWTLDAPDFISQKIRDKILKWANNEVKQYRIRLFDAKTPNQTITQRNAVFIESPIPEEILDYLYDKKTTKRGGVYLEGGQVHLSLGRFSGPRGKVSYGVSQAVATMANQAKTRFPYTYGGFGGSMSKSLRGKGYYGLVKLIDAFFHELNGWEDYSEGTSPMRTDLYQSYGWLNAYAYPTNTPYFTQAAEDYLEAKRKGATKEARYDNIWRPVYSTRSNPHYSPPPGIAMFPGELHQGPAALYQQTISISQLNPPRSKPFPWNKNRVKKSPFKTMKKAQATYDSWKKGNPIGFSANSSLKSMGKIPRASGKYELGEKYERINPPEEHIHWDEYHSHMTDYHVDERQNPAKKACPKPPKKGIIIYGASYCHWCQEAKKHLDEKGKKYKYVDIQEVKDYNKTIYPLTDNYKYIPVIFVDGKFIGGYDALVSRKNPPIQPMGFKTSFKRFIIGSDYGEAGVEGDNGHKIDGGQFSHDMLGRAETIVIDTKDYPTSKEFLEREYRNWLKGANSIGLKDGGWFESLKAIVSLKRFSPKQDMFDEMLDVNKSMIDKTWTIDEIDNYGGVCRHLGLLAAWILERAIKDGHLRGKVYFDHGVGHAWARYVTKGGESIIFDAMQEKYGYLKDVNGGAYPGYNDSEGNRYYYPGMKPIPLSNPMAPGYQSYGWTTQDWRSIKVNSKGDIDYSEKCGAEGTRTKSGKPRLCLPAPVIRSLMKTESGKEVLRKQARKKLRAKKGEKVPWHPRIKKLHKKLEERTPEDR